MPETDSSNDDIETRVLDAASELFVHYGYDKTTMNDIASKAGVAKSTIYLRWKKKEDLFEALLVRESYLVMDDWFTRVEADPRGGAIGSWFRHAIAASFSNPFLKAVYKQDRRVLGSMIQQMGQDNVFIQRQTLFMKVFEELQAVNAIRKDVDLQSVSFLLNSMHFGLIHIADVVPEAHTPPLEKVWETMVELVERMMMPEDGGDVEAGKIVLRRFMAQVRLLLNDFVNKQL